MNPPLHPRRLSRILLGLAALTFTQCEKPGGNSPTGPATPTTPGVAANSVSVISEGASPAFRSVASRLELGGSSYQYSEAGGVPAFAAFLDEFVKALPEAERRDMPPGFTFTKLFQILGLDSIAAAGSSVRARGDGTFHSRGFAFMPQGRKGLMTLTGRPSEKLMLTGIAPKDSDLAVEFPLNLKDFARDGLPGILAMIPAAGRTEFEKEMSVPRPPLGISSMQIIEKLDARVGIFLRLDPSQKFQPTPDAPPMPGVDGVIAIDRLGWLVEALKPQFMPAFSQPGSPASLTDEGGVLTLRFTDPSGPPPMDYRPVVRFDPKADRILIASRPALFDSVISGNEKITQGADFSQAWRDLPSEGNACLYVSPRLLLTVSDLIAKSAQRESSTAADAAMMRKMFEWVKPFLSRGQALVIANQPDGILALSNTSIPADVSSMSTVSTLAILAGIAVPAVSKARQKALQVSDMNTLKQLNLGLKMYAADKGRYPASLSDLVPKYVTGNQMLEFTDSRTKQRMPWLYRSSLTETSPANEVILAAPLASPDGMRLVGLNDGSVKSVSEAEFQLLWNRK